MLKVATKGDITLMCGAGIFCTGAKTPSGKKVTVGLLARLETNVKAQAFRLAVRAAYPQVGLAVAAVMQNTLAAPELAQFVRMGNSRTAQ